MTFFHVNVRTNKMNYAEKNKWAGGTIGNCHSYLPILKAEMRKVVPFSNLIVT